MNSKLKRRTPWTAAIALLVVVAVLSVQASQTGCASVHLPEYLALTQPDPLQAAWNYLFFRDVWSDRVLTLLISAVILACIFSWTAYFDSGRGRILTVVVAGLLIAVQSQNVAGWTVLDAVRSLLTVLAILVTWRLSRRASGGIGLAYVFLAILMAIYGTGLLVLGFGVFLLFTAKGNARILTIFSFVIGGASIVLWRNGGIPAALGTPAVALPIPVPLFLAFLWLLASIGAIAYLMDRANRHAWGLLAISLLVPVLYMLTGNILNAFTAIALIPTILSLTWALRATPARVKCGIAAITLILMSLPQTVDTQEHTVADRLSYLNAAGMPRVVYAAEDFAITALGERLERLSCSPQPQDVYYIIDKRRLLKTTPRGTAEVLSVGQLRSLPGFSLIDNAEQPLAVWDKQLIINDSVPQYDRSKYRSTFYYAVPPQEIVYQTDNILLHSFKVQDRSLRETNTFASGDHLIIASWWGILKPLNENFVAKFSLINSRGLPLSAQESLLGNLFTGDMPEGQLLFHRAILDIPVDTVAGDYSLVVSVHGTAHKTANQHFIGPGGVDVGEYAYLTTIHVK